MRAIKFQKIIAVLTDRRYVLCQYARATIGGAPVVQNCNFLGTSESDGQEGRGST